MLFILHQSYLNQITNFFWCTLFLSSHCLCRGGTQDKDYGGSEQQVLCADLEINSAEFLPPKFSSPYGTCPIYRKEQKIQTKKIMLLTIFISSQIKIAVIFI